MQSPAVNRGEGTAKDKADWVSYLNGPREGKPNTPNRLPAETSHSPAYDPGQRFGSEESNGSEESDSSEGSKDQDMVDLTEDEATANVGDPSESSTQEEDEEHFIEALMMRNQDGK